MTRLHLAPKVLMAVAAVALLSACATKPEPVVEQVAAPAPAPVFVEPEPAPVVQTAPAPLVAPVVDANLPIPGSQADFVFRAGGDARVYFGYDQYRLSPEAINALRAQADWLKLYDNVTAVIEGNADERGTREYNLALGARRAEAVKSFLVGQGVAPSRLTTVSYGKERPIDGRSNEEGWARNRNGHTNLMTGTVG